MRWAHGVGGDTDGNIPQAATSGANKSNPVTTPSRLALSRKTTAAPQITAACKIRYKVCP